MTHFYMLHCQKELTHAFTNWLTLSTNPFWTDKLKLNLNLNLNPSSHNCLISDDPHIGILISWPITLKVDIIQFESHLSLLMSKHNMRVESITTNVIEINETVLTELHEIRTFLICCVSFCVKYSLGYVARCAYIKTKCLVFVQVPWYYE